MRQPVVTFIIPSIGRASLNDTLNSLKRQTLPDQWSARVMFDGVESTIRPDDDPRVEILTCEKVGHTGQIHSCVGQVRNLALELPTATTTTWYAFVDDDDIVSDDYVERLLQESEAHPDQDIIVFRMVENIYGRKVIPGEHEFEFAPCRVGISFAIKAATVKTRFVPSEFEDCSFLQRAIQEGSKIMGSPYVTYFVRDRTPVTQSFVGGNRFFCSR